MYSGKLHFISDYHFHSLNNLSLSSFIATHIINIIYNAETTNAILLNTFNCLIQSNTINTNITKLNQNDIGVLISLFL